MTLRKKTILIISATLIGLLLILFAVSQGILLSSFSRLEVENTSKNVGRAQSALSDDISSLVTMTRDWAAWDDTYNFIENGNNEYIEANPTDTTFEGLRVNVMLFINFSGQIVYSKALDLQNEQEVPVPESLRENLASSSLLTYHPNAESEVSGLLLLPEGPMLIASQPILTSQNEGPVRGALIMGRYLDSAEIGSVAETTRLSLTVQRLDEPQMPSDFEVARSSLSGNTPIFVKALDKNSVAGYALLNDVYGTPAIMLRVDLPREIYQQGQASQRYFIVSIIGVGLVFGIVVLLLLGKSVLSPLSRLSATVSSIGRTGALSARVSATGKDELSNLASEINRMLESLERSHDELRESEEKFKRLVEDMNDGYFVVQNFRIVFANARSAELFGYSVEDATGKTVGELLPPETVNGLSEWHTRRLRGEVVPQQYETTLTRYDGTTVMVEFGAKRMYYAGKPAVSVVMRDITKRRQTEEALRESEEKYRDVIERASDLITIVQDTIIKYVNPRSSDLLGYQPKEIIGTPITEHIHPDRLQQVISRHERRLSGEHVDSIYETALLRKDGSIVEVEMNAGVITYGGRPADLVIVRDITERKKAQQALRESEEHYSALVGSLSDAVFKFKGQVIAWCNDRVEGIYGYTKDELIGKKASFLFPIDVNLGEFIVGISAAIKERGFFRSSGKVNRKDGSVADIEYTISQIPGKEPIELVSIAHDITERKRMDEALRQSEQSYRVLLESTHDSIIVVDAKTFKIAFGNRRASMMFGFDPVLQDGVGMNLLDFVVHPEDREIAIKGFVEDLYQAERRRRYDVRAKTQDGREIWISALGTRIEFQGRVAVLLSLRDVTKDKQMEEEKRRLEEQIRLAGRLAAVGELAAGVAHELNNPIAAIQGFAQFLRTRKDLDETLRKDLDTIYRESQRAAKITQNLLSFARRHEPEKHSISINEVIKKTLELRAHPMKVNNIELVVELDPDLPGTLADFHQMQQVFVNIINNAEQAMIEAHGKGKLVVKTQRAGNMIRISFADNGPGISEEDIKRIFDPFFTTKEVGKGTGLGLSICYGLVEAHGGHIYAKSKLGQGATFVVEIPIASKDQLVAETALLNPGSRGVKWNKPGEQY